MVDLKMTEFVTADTHFSHTRIIPYTDRPFSNVETMNETMIDRWNAVVEPNDIVYHLGDFSMWHDDMLIIKELNGKIILIKGNHDKFKYLKLFHGWAPYMGLRIGKYWCLLQHYPVKAYAAEKIGNVGSRKEQSWFNPHQKKEESDGYDYVLCGHVHNDFLWNGRNFNMSTELWNYTPVLLKWVEKCLIDNESEKGKV